jgi:hypothetical protein
MEWLEPYDYTSFNVDFSNSSIQWFRIQPEGSKKEIISG